MIKRISIFALVLVIMISVFSFAVPANELDDAVAPDVDIMTAPKGAEDAVEVITPISPVAENAKNMQFEPMAFVENLNIMGIGMLGIFIVIGAIILSVFVLNKLTSKNPDKQ